MVPGLQAEPGLRVTRRPLVRLSGPDPHHGAGSRQVPLGPRGCRRPVRLQHSSCPALAQVQVQGQEQVPREPQVTEWPA